MATTNSAGRPPDPILVTGSSTGLGLETALYLAERGFRVHAAVRNPDHVGTLREASAAHGVTLEVVRLDLTDHASIDQAVATTVADSGGIFGLVNNGGVGLRGCLEDVSDAEIRDVFEPNVFGTIAVTKAVLPHMRAAGRGRVVTISSVGGRIATFGLSIYNASKFAQEGLGEALALELAPFGLQAVLVEPGIVRTTRWTTHRGTAEKALDPERPYFRMFQAAEELADRFVERSRTRPVDVAKTVHRALTVEKPQMRYVVGRPASAAVLVRRFLPERLFERVYFGTLLRQIRNRALAAEQR